MRLLREFGDEEEVVRTLGGVMEVGDKVVFWWGDESVGGGGFVGVL